MPLLLRATIAIHVIAIALTMADPSLWPWTLGTIAANHVLLTALSINHAARCSVAISRGCRPRRSRAARWR